MLTKLYENGFTVTLDMGSKISANTNKGEYGIGAMIKTFSKCLLACGFDIDTVNKEFIRLAEDIKEKQNETSS